MYPRLFLLVLSVVIFSACGGTATPEPLLPPTPFMPATATAVPAPTSEPTQSPLATSIPTVPVTVISQQPPTPVVVQFARGTDSITLQGVAHGVNTPSYSLQAFGGQTMAVTIESPGMDVYTAVYAPNEQHALDRSVSNATSWEYYLPSDQAYIVTPRHDGSEPTPYTITIRIYNKEAVWQTFEDSENGYAFSYPSHATLDVENGYPVINNQIYVLAGSLNPLMCRGDCPLIDTIQPVTAAGRPATKVTGEIGSIGGNIPQHYLQYVFEADDTFYTMTLYALDFKSADPNDWPDDPRPQPDDIALFEQIVETFTLIE